MFVLRGRGDVSAANREAKKLAPLLTPLGREIAARATALTSSRDEKTVELFVSVAGRRTVAQVERLYEPTEELLLLVRLRPSAADEAVDFARYFGSDPAALGAAKVLEGFARTSLPIALVAEEGVDVERIASMIHAASERREEGFASIDMAELETVRLVEALDRTAITVRGGTVLLTNLDRSSKSAQEAVLRAWESPRLSELRYVVSSTEDPRLLARRNLVVQSLAKLLSVALVLIPPLRERGDLRPRLEHRLGDAAIAPAALAKLAAYAFPENDLELEQIVEEIISASRGERIQLEHLPDRVTRPPDPTDKMVGKRSAAERLALEEALRNAGGNLSRAAKILGVARATLYRLMKKHAIMAP